MKMRTPLRSKTHFNLYQTHRGSIGFGAWSYLQKKDTTIAVNKQFVVYVIDANDEVVENYEKIFSPIQTLEEADPRKETVFEPCYLQLVLQRCGLCFILVEPNRPSVTRLFIVKICPWNQK